MRKREGEAGKLKNTIPKVMHGVASRCGVVLLQEGLVHITKYKKDNYVDILKKQS